MLYFFLSLSFVFLSNPLELLLFYNSRPQNITARNWHKRHLMSVKKSIAVCKLNGAHAAIEDNTKHVESRLQENKKLLVHLSLHCLFCLLLGVHNTSKFKEESCSDSKLLYIHAVEIQCYRETRILFSLRAEHLSA